MASNYGSNQEMERALREHFEAEAEDLRAPQHLWQSIEGQMDLQPTRHPVTQVRRKILGALKQNWFPMLATGGAVAVAASAVIVLSNAEVETQIVTKEVPVEKIVIKEVPVERIVRETEIREVPVEKIVTQQVDRVVTQTVEVEKVVTQTVEVEKVVEVERVVEKVVEKVVEVMPEAPPQMAAPSRTQVPVQPQAAPTQAPRASTPAGTAAGAPARPPATTFQDYGRQPFVATAEDAVSTFSLDTDRTSYQLALSWLQEDTRSSLTQFGPKSGSTRLTTASSCRPTTGASPSPVTWPCIRWMAASTWCGLASRRRKWPTTGR